jgi:CRISPR-associated protein Cas2
MARQLYLASYDVSSPQRLRIALRVARDYATGGQYSVHEVWLTPAERRELLDRMSRVLDLEADRFFLLRLDPRQDPWLLGVAIPPQDGSCYVVA